MEEEDSSADQPPERYGLWLQLLLLCELRLPHCASWTAPRLCLCAGTPNKEVQKLIEPFVYEWTAKRKGSISAEHGLGQMKAEYIG